jgi:hypothetical protein
LEGRRKREGKRKRKKW